MSGAARAGSGVVGILRAGRQPVSSSSVAVLRIAFGVAMVINTLLYVPRLVREYYVDATVHFGYGPLDAVDPPPGLGIYVVYAAMAVTGTMIALGWHHRVAAWSFFALTTYVFLLDSTYYQNHEYLISLLAVLLAVLPVDGRWSLDARRHPERRADTVPAWVVWLLRFQIGVPYFFGGVAKLNGDWLRGEPLRMWLADRTDIGPIDGALTTEWVVLVMAYGALALDLSVVWLLLHRRTRVPAFVVATGFHLLNVWLWGLFIFPWLMIAATTIFFPPDWPERVRAHLVARGLVRRAGPRTPGGTTALPWQASPALASVLVVWVVVQLLVPLRHYAIDGSANWTEEGHRFAWHMKLRDKTGEASFVVSAHGRTWVVDPRDHLTPKQLALLPGHPERLVHFAHHLADLYGGAEVRARTSVSLNGRAPQPIVDPAVDLAAISPTWWGPAPWILPLEQPLRS